MSGVGDGYVVTSEEAVRVRRLQKQREAEYHKIQKSKRKTASGQKQSRLLQFDINSCEILENDFKKEIVGLVTREEYVEKIILRKTNIRCGKLGNDPSTETNSWHDSEREAEEQAEPEKLKKQ